MPQSLSQIYVHLVFSTKQRAKTIPSTLQPRLHAYLAGALNDIDEFRRLLELYQVEYNEAYVWD